MFQLTVKVNWALHWYIHVVNISTFHGRSQSLNPSIVCPVTPYWLQPPMEGHLDPNSPKVGNNVNIQGCIPYALERAPSLERLPSLERAPTPKSSEKRAPLL